MEIVREDYFYDNNVQNRNHLENRGFFYYPECPITPALKNYDENLDIWKSPRTGQLRIIDNTYHTIMEISPSQEHHGTVEHIKRIDSRKGYRAIEEIERAELKMEIDQRKKTEDISFNLAKDTKKIVQSLG